ncbi:YajQ family cyclic di-GMP-binding protein [Candidatus Saccharibacteria bacterium CPR2]|nr:YajQ family cyclic di-GMP-binding protein [Candidatus Saccharibacteria bacterium CPR2]
MALFSFDIVSDYDKHEMDNVLDQTRREIASRYDFKGTNANFEILGDKKGLKIIGDNDYQIDAIIDILRKKSAARGVSQKVFNTSNDTVTSGMSMTKEVLFKSGLDQEKAKKITKLIRDHFPKVKSQIQGQEIRVSSPKKDELQAVMALIKEQDFDFPLNFTNFR